MFVFGIYEVSVASIVGFTLLIFGLSFFVLFWIIENMIHQKIKLIYKTIHTAKVSKEEKQKSVSMRQDIFHKVNDEVIQWAEQRETEIENLKKMEAYRREFLGNVSHELKTPIFNIQGYILTLLDGAADDTQITSDYLQKAEINIERMINIVQDLEIISQLEAGELKLNNTKFDLVSLSKEIFDLLDQKAKQKNIVLTFNEKVKPDLPVYVLADKEKIRQVITNLVDNSIKYGKSEGGRTKLSFYDMDENILVEVADNGIGIDSKNLPRVFERFYRVDKSRSRSQGGSGLGLSIVKHIIESHEQTLNVRSTIGVGSTFSFTLKKG